MNLAARSGYFPVRLDSANVGLINGLITYGF